MRKHESKALIKPLLYSQISRFNALDRHNEQVYLTSTLQKYPKHTCILYIQYLQVPNIQIIQSIQNM